MYKKIEHNIIEEHFDHPGILPEKLKAQAGVPAGAAGPVIPPVVINEATMTFRMDCRTLWTRYSLGMVNLSVVTLGNMTNISDVEANLFKSASDIGTFFVPYYGITAGYKIGNLLTVYARIGVDELNAIKSGKDLIMFRSLWISPINEIAEYFSDLNPTYYPKELLVDQFTALARLWGDNFHARFKSDAAANQSSLDNIIKLAVSGVPNHVNKGYSSIADTLSKGVIAQFPLSFV